MTKEARRTFSARKAIRFIAPIVAFASLSCSTPAERPLPAQTPPSVVEPNTPLVDMSPTPTLWDPTKVPLLPTPAPSTTSKEPDSAVEAPSPKTYQIIADVKKISKDPEGSTRIIDGNLDSYTVKETIGEITITFSRYGNNYCYLVVEGGRNYQDFYDPGCTGRVTAITIKGQKEPSSKLLTGEYLSRNSNNEEVFEQTNKDYLNWLRHLGVLR